MQESFICHNAVSKVTVHACDDDGCVNETAIFTLLPDGRMEVVANFTNLVENRNYSATVQIKYSGGVVQHSLPVDASMYDICDVVVFNF